MRYDTKKQIYRDCPFCTGRGCLACPGEATKEYERQCPRQPILAIKREDAATLRPVLSPEAMQEATEEGRRRAKEMIAQGDVFAQILDILEVPGECIEDALALDITSEIIQENLKKVGNDELLGIVGIASATGAI